jgi:signal transduction histidine kinase
LSVKAKISLGFTLVLALHASIAIVAHIGQEKAERDLAVHDALRQELIECADLDTAIRELERGVLLYVQTGNVSTAERTAGLHETIRNRLVYQSGELTDTEEADHLKKMLGHLDRYGELFAAVTRDRGTRDQLYDNTLLPAYNKLCGLLRTLTQHEDEGTRMLAHGFEGLIREAQVAALSYLRTPDSDFLTLAKSPIQEMQGQLESDGETFNVVTENAAEQLAQSLTEYEKGLIQIVQATRAYLYLVNVAMAGEAAEFLRLSRETRANRTASIEQLTLAIESDHRQFAGISNIIAVVTVVLGIIAGIWISRAIAPPLRAITRTLKELADGRSTAEIPFADRQDEIGELSAAAQVFRQRTEQIEELLAQARHSEHHLRLNEQVLSRKNAELDEFANVASRDLLGPLRKLMASCRNLATDLSTEMKQEAKHELENIADSANRMHAIVGSLLALSRSGQGEFKQVSVKLDACVDEALARLSPQVKATGAIIERADLPEVHGDARLLTQLYQHLIGNALRFVHDGDTPRIRLTVESMDDELVLGVDDNGIGINPEDAEKIFSPFKRLDERAAQAGTGMGLAICRKAVQRHGGRIWVESETGSGSRFRFTLNPGTKPLGSTMATTGELACTP